MQRSDVADVTVVIPAYNRASMVGAAVDSAFAQVPRPPARVIVVDDGSADNTAEVARAHGAEVIVRENGGVGEARNTGIEAADTEWIALLDSDDRWLPHHIATTLALAPGHVLVGTAAVVMPRADLRAGWTGPRPLTVGPADLLWPGSPFVPSTMVFRRADALAIGCFRPVKLAEDLDFEVRILELGTGLVSPDVTAHYCLHGEQETSDNSGSKQARIDVIQAFSDRPWYPRHIVRDLVAADAWDALRRAQRQRDTAGALRAAGHLARPTSIRPVLSLLNHRAKSRRAGV